MMKKFLMVFVVLILTVPVAFVMSACRSSGNRNRDLSDYLSLLPAPQIFPIVDVQPSQIGDRIIERNDHTILLLNDATWSIYAGGWIYVTGGNWFDFRIRPNGTQTQQLPVTPAVWSTVQYYDGWLYFRDDFVTSGDSVGGRLHRMRPDGSRQMVYKYTQNVQNFVVSDGRIYHLEGETSIVGTLYVMNIDGSSRQQVTQSATSFIVEGDNLFVSMRKTEESPVNTAIYRFGLDGGNGVLLVEEDGFTLFPVAFCGEFLYFNVLSNIAGQHLDRIRLDKTGRRRVASYDVGFIGNVLFYDGYIFYNHITHEGNAFVFDIVRLQTNGDGRTVLFADAAGFDIVGGNIIFGDIVSVHPQVVNVMRGSVNGGSPQMFFNNVGRGTFVGYFIIGDRVFMRIR